MIYLETKGGGAMDYVFFAFSSLSLGFSLLLLLLLIRRSDRPLSWLYFAGSVVAAAFYYATLVSLARNSLAVYLLLNLLPQISMLLLLVLTIKRYSRR